MSLVDVGDLIILKDGSPCMVMRKGFTRRFEYKDGASDKFWEIRLDGSDYIVHYGRRGSTGTEQKKNFGNEYAAKKEYEKIVNEKLKKGYKETANQNIYTCLKPGAGKKYINYSDSDIQKALAKKEITIKKRGASGE